MIEIKNLNFSYDDNTPVFTKLNLTIPTGQFITILGHNGSGKSTLSKLLTGLTKPKDGTIHINGAALTEENLQELRKNISIVFQNPNSQLVASTVEDDIAFGLETRQIAPDDMQKIVKKYINKVGLKGLEKREPHHLSGGQKQRVAIAGALATGTNILIFDEATSMLDPAGREEITKLIKEIATSKNKTILNITHHFDEAVFADRVIVLDNGKIILDGTPEQVFKQQKVLEAAKLGIPFVTKMALALGFDETYIHEHELIKTLKARTKGRALLPDESEIQQNNVALKTDIDSKSKSTLIKFNAVSHSYQINTPFEAQALHDVNLEINAGEILAIIGRTGSGKSTLIEHMNALLLPTSGTIQILDRKIRAGQKFKELKDIRSKIGIVFQFPEYQLFEETVLKDIMFGPLNYGQSISVAEISARKAAKTVGIDDELLTQSPFALSGGQMRRVAIAGILAMEPDVLLLDEPTAGLDPNGAYEIMKIFSALHRNHNTTIVLITHDMDLVSKYANKVVVMNSGKIVLEGSTHNILKQGSTFKNHGLFMPTIPRIFSKIIDDKLSPDEPMPLTLEDFINRFQM